MNKVNLINMRIRLLAFILIIFCCCGRKNANEKDSIDSVLRIDLLSEAEAKVTKLSDFVENIEYIPLQTIESSLMGGYVSYARKIVNTDKRIYILSRDELLCFEMDGKYLFKLEKRGRGPEEYLTITDFDVSFDNKDLAILSSTDSKVMIYGITATGFTFQRSISLGDPKPYRISLVPETEYIFLAIPPWRGTEPTLSLMINTIGDTVYFKPNCYNYEYVNNKGIGGVALNQMLVYSIGNIVCFKETFSDTVFYVDANDNSFKPRMIFNSHGTFITPEMRGGSETPGSTTNWIANIFEMSRYVFYWYGTRITRNRILLDKKANTKYRLETDNESKSQLKDDICGGPDFNIEFIDNYCSGDKLFSFTDPITLKRYIESVDFTNAKVKYPEKKEELKQLADSLKETDNPVLIIVTPKE